MTETKTAKVGPVRAALAALRGRAPGAEARRHRSATEQTTGLIREMQENTRLVSKGASRTAVADRSSSGSTAATTSSAGPELAPAPPVRRHRFFHIAFRLSAAGAGLALLVAMFAFQAIGGSSEKTKAIAGPTGQTPLAGPPATGGSGFAINSQSVANIASDAEVGGVASEGGVPEASIEAAKAAPAHVGRFDLPLKKWFMVTDRYGAPRGKGIYHGGIDLALDGLPQSPVYVACEGKVSIATYNAVLGNHVIIDCGDDWATVYAHLSKSNVTVGQAVHFEEVLGISGSTGFSSGEHLHFEIRWQGWAVNPEKYLEFHIAPGAPLTYDKRDANGELIIGPIATATHTPTPTPTPDFSIVPLYLRPTVAATKTPIPTPTPVPPTPTITPTPTVTPRAGQIGF